MRRFLLGLSAVWAMSGAALAETVLLMFEQPGCIYCARWHAEVGPGYPLSTEGKAAPLVQLHLRAELPDGIVLASAPAFTPTFVLVHNGTEAGRIEGYPGADFFWPILAKMLQEVH